MSHIFLRNSRRNLLAFLLINVSWVDIYCALTICFTCTTCIRELKTEESEHKAWGLIDSAQLSVPRFRSCTAIPNFAQKPVVYLGWKRYIQSLLLVQLHWSIQNSSCMWNVPMFLACGWAWVLRMPSKNCMRHDPSGEAWKVRRNAILVFVGKNFIQWQVAIQYVITAGKIPLKAKPWRNRAELNQLSDTQNVQLIYANIC